MEYKGIDKEAILQRDLEIIVKYRIKKNRGFQRLANALIILTGIGIILYFSSYIYPDIIAQTYVLDKANTPVMVSGLLIFCISFILFCITYARIHKNTMTAVRKEYNIQ